MDAGKSGVWAIVVAAGKGVRLGLPYNKVFMKLAGRSLLSRCFDALAEADVFEGAVLALSGEDVSRYRALCREEGAPALVRRVVEGGASRQASVRGALSALPGGARIAAIHDGARAFVPVCVVRECVFSALEQGSGVAATMLSDTIKRVDEQGRSVETPERARLRAVQTPQAFRVEDIKKAHELALIDLFEATDDAALVERYIGPVRLCCSEAGVRNVKITTMEDVRNMEQRLMGDTRIGHGYDVHRLVPDRKLILCGVEVPFEMGLLGHSDADVAAHALMDALLGAAGLGDIGRHFPDTDPRYEGADSLGLLREVVQMLAERGCAPGNADLTVVCQRPKLAPFMEAMRENIAGALGIDPGRVNVKATTTEGLGFEGAGEGISASAVVMIHEIASREAALGRDNR